MFETILKKLAGFVKIRFLVSQNCKKIFTLPRPIRWKALETSLGNSKRILRNFRNYIPSPAVVSRNRGAAGYYKGKNPLRPLTVKDETMGIKIEERKIWWHMRAPNLLPLRPNLPQCHYLCSHSFHNNCPPSYILSNN